MRWLIFIFAAFPLCDSSKLEEFLFENQELCGYPFSDAQWLPVLDICDIKCEPDTEICVENDDLIQRCNQLPAPCVNMWRERQRTLERQRSRDSLLFPTLMLATDYKFWRPTIRQSEKTNRK